MAARTRPPTDRPGHRRICPIDAGTPNAERSGRRISRPRVQAKAPLAAGTTSSPPSPSSLHSSTAQGLRTTNESAPASIGIPSMVVLGAAM